MVVIEENGVKYYIDGRLLRDLRLVVERVSGKDDDHLFVVDGEERSGKSVLTMQLAKTVDPSFNLSRVAFTPEQFRDAVLKAGKGEAVVFDEAFRGLSSRGALSEVNRLLVSLMMEMGQKNLFVFVVLPTVFLLDKYVALFRSSGLFRVYRRRGKRGFWEYYNKRKLKSLYLKGRVDMSYVGVDTWYRGRFLNQYVVSEDGYRALKAKAFKEANSGEKPVVGAKYKKQRDILLCYIKKRFGLPLTELSSDLRAEGFRISAQGIGLIVKE